MNSFVVKGSQDRCALPGGMIREPSKDKIDFSLVYDGPMLSRWAEHITKGAKKYAKRNWMKGEGQEVLERFRESAARHFHQWMNGETDEDHAAAVIFNLNGYEYLKEKEKSNNGKSS